MRYAVPFILLCLVPCSLGCAQPASTPEPTDSNTATPFSWPAFDEAVAAAKKSGKPILVDIYAPWCGWCRKMQAEVYTNEELQTYVKEHFEYGRLNIDDSETQHQFKEYVLTSEQLGYALGAQGTPTTVFLESNGDYITRLDGYWNLDGFRKAVRYIGSKAYHNQRYDEFIETSGDDAR